MRVRILSVIVFAVLLLATPLLAEGGAEWAIAIENDDVDAIKALLEGGAAVDTPIEYGEHKITPLIKAAWDGTDDIVAVLLEAGANVNAAASDTGETALMNAVTREHLAVVKRLLAAKADVKPKNAFQFNAFTIAVNSGNEEIAKLLLDAGAKIGDGAHTLTPLHFAAAAGNTSMIRFLVKHGANINAGSTDAGMTPLMQAIYAAKTDSVKTLIELKAKVNTKTSDGTSPLSLAENGEQEDIVALLKAAGAKK